MNPFELLKKDHETVATLFDRIEAASGQARIAIFEQINSELELHAHIEETIFYPAIERARETRAITLEAYEEHKVVKELLAELGSAKSVSDEWNAKLTVLRENVEHHVDEEENEMFDKASDVLTAEEAEALGERMRAEKVKQGGKAPEPEKPGLLQTIANTLGFGAPPPPAGKSASKKKATRAKAATKATGQPKSASKSGATRKAGKSAAKKTSKSRTPKSTKKKSTKPKKEAKKTARKKTSAKASKSKPGR